MQSVSPQRAGMSNQVLADNSCAGLRAEAGAATAGMYNVAAARLPWLCAQLCCVLRQRGAVSRQQQQDIAAGLRGAVCGQYLAWS